MLLKGGTIAGSIFASYPLYIINLGVCRFPSLTSKTSCLSSSPQTANGVSLRPQFFRFVTYLYCPPTSIDLHGIYWTHVLSLKQPKKTADFQSCSIYCKEGGTTAFVERSPKAVQHMKMIDGHFVWNNKIRCDSGSCVGGLCLFFPVKTHIFPPEDPSRDGAIP